MKGKLLKYLFSILTSTYFMFAGVGYNVVRYCCDSCEQQGIEAVASTSCQTIHHSHHHNSDACACDEHPSEDYACSDLHHQPGGCHLLRLQIDTPSIQGILAIDQQTVSTINLFYISENKLLLDDVLTITLINSPPEKPTPSSGRDLLALNSILLI